MRIHGIKIFGFPCGDTETSQQICDFYIEDDRHEFVIKVDDYPIEKASELLHREYLFCVDVNEKAFTLYDCYLMPLQIPVKQMKIVWNKCLMGYHISNIESEKIKSAEYIVQTDRKCPFHLFVTKHCFDVLSGKAHISTCWNVENTKIEGVAIHLSVADPVSIARVETIILRLLEIYSLQLGFFPTVRKRRLVSAAQKEYYFIQDFAAYGKTAKRNITFDFVLTPKDNSALSSIYDKWWELREKEAVTFNLFSYLTRDSSPVMEIPVATCIQCFEGYFRTHHAEQMLKFSKNIKQQIRQEILRLLDSSDHLKKICEENGILLEDIKTSFKQMSGHINERSLKDILRYAINGNNATKRLFEYEETTKTSANTTLLDLFLQKASGHRNWLSHLIETEKCFVREEIHLAEKKLKLLFRLTLLYDIGCEVTDKSLDSAIANIDKWYDTNTLT